MSTRERQQRKRNDEEASKRQEHESSHSNKSQQDKFFKIQEEKRDYLLRNRNQANHQVIYQQSAGLWNKAFQTLYQNISCQTTTAHPEKKNSMNSRPSPPDFLEVALKEKIIPKRLSKMQVVVVNNKNKKGSICGKI